MLTLGALIVKSVVDPLGVPQAAQPNYAGVLTATVAGILDGYNTLDAIAAFVFATLVTNFVREGGAKTAKEVTSQVYKSGILAVSLLAVIYFFIAKIGAESVTAIGMQDTGAPVLAETAKILFGNFGAILLSVIVLLACLTTSIGLITCCAAYFMRIVGRLTYKQYCLLFTIVSFLIGMFGLKTIIVSTIPVLMFVYRSRDPDRAALHGQALRRPPVRLRLHHRLHVRDGRGLRSRNRRREPRRDLRSHQGLRPVRPVRPRLGPVRRHRLRPRPRLQGRRPLQGLLQAGLTT